MPLTLTRDELVATFGTRRRAGSLRRRPGRNRHLLRHGEVPVPRPRRSDADYQGLTAYLQSIRDAFDDRSIRRGIVVVEGNTVACQTWIEGTFVRPFTQSPAGSLEPNGTRVTWDLMNMFKFDDAGRMVEENVRTDNRSILRQLGAPGA